ncbi:unnamed protein product, partial [Vitrella brassicaformis CCMP3155]
MINRPTGDTISPGDTKEEDVPPQLSDGAEGRHESALRSDTQIFIDFSNQDICTAPPCSQGIQPKELSREDDHSAVLHLNKVETHSNDALLSHQSTVTEQAKQQSGDTAHSTTLQEMGEEPSLREEEMNDMGEEPSLRPEEMRICEMKRELEMAAGYAAAFEEAPSTLVYTGGEEV